LQQITIDGQTYLVDERIARMVTWLLSQRERIERVERVRVEFNCAGRRIVTEIHEGGKA
jgi:hypothetical protein